MSHSWFSPIIDVAIPRMPRLLPQVLRNSAHGSLNSTSKSVARAMLADGAGVSNSRRGDRRSGEKVQGREEDRRRVP